MTAPYYSDDRVTVHAGDCLDVLATLPDASVDAVVTDPPYALGFMGKEWDKIGDTGRGARARVERAAEVTPTGQGHTTSGGAYLAAGVDSLRSAGRPFQDWCRLWATECLRVLKPGGHMLAFGGTRTWHRLSCAVEDAGFEIRDSIAWLYGSGFPKSLDVSKAIDRAAGAERERYDRPAFGGTFSDDNGTTYGTAISETPVTPDAERWQGWGTALKPAFEPIVVARKPLAGTVAANVLAHGTGALNIDGCRIGDGEDRASGGVGAVRSGIGPTGIVFKESRPTGGRWPANVAFDETQAEALDQQSGTLTSGKAAQGGHVRNAISGEGIYGGGKGLWQESGSAGELYGDSGGASRYFFVSSTTIEPWQHGENSTRDANTSAGKRTENTSSNSPTDGSGSRQTDPSPRATTSTTETTTRSTTPPKTCNCSQPKSTETTTIETAKTIPSSTESNTAAASDATRCCHCKSSQSDGQGHIRGTAESASASTSANGELLTETGTTPTCAPIESLGNRFFYTAKADSNERPRIDGVAHPTVKSLNLMRWLVRLVTPPGGKILDPFAGSGTTGEAALLEGFQSILVERETDYLPLITQRIHRRLNPVEAIRQTGGDLGLFGEPT